MAATCFASAASQGSTWNRVLIQEVGEALGREAASMDVDDLLAPGLNLKRSPVGGRNFEYFSEDPMLIGALGASFVRGVQAVGVGTGVKHFVANDTEDRRYGTDVRVDQRALRELYLAAFEPVVVGEQPATVMAAYSKLNGEHCTENAWLLTGLLRGEWKFAGAVISDWGAAWDRTRSVPGGLDLEMSGIGGSRELVRAVRQHRVPRGTLARAAGKVRALGARTPAAVEAYAADAHHELAARAAAEGMVLLKNDGGLLPLTESTRVAVIGAFAESPRYQGAGSSHVVPTRLTTVLGALSDRAIGAVPFAAGYRLDQDTLDEGLVAAAVELAATVDVPIVVVGLPGAYETEGLDRPHMRLPESHDALVRAVAEANPNTVIVLQNRSPVELPWREEVPAILETYLAGQAGGDATADVLLGVREQGGRLAESFPVTWTDHPVAHIPRSPLLTEYRESIYVGYRYFDTAGVAVGYPFGHGLSYTTFEWSDVEVEPEAADGLVACTVRIRNSGLRRGSEVVQLYVHATNPTGVFRADQDLRAFEKVDLNPGESAVVRFVLDDRAFAVWDVDRTSWVVESGSYELRVAASSRDIRSRVSVAVAGAEPTTSSLVDAAYRELAPVTSSGGNRSRVFSALPYRMTLSRFPASSRSTRRSAICNAPPTPDTSRSSSARVPSRPSAYLIRVSSSTSSTPSSASSPCGCCQRSATARSSDGRSDCCCASSTASTDQHQRPGAHTMPHTVSNPIDLTYRFQDVSIGPFFRGVGREGADPSLVCFDDRYYMFVSMSGGFWHSDDLLSWEYVALPTIPAYDYAPDVRVVDGYLVVCASRASKPCNFFRTNDPLSGVWEEIPGTFAFWDPNLFQDDDGRLYLYQGCSSRKPIDVVELDRETFTPMGSPIPLIGNDTAHHGWERLGENWNPSNAPTNIVAKVVSGGAPFIEGAWMTKHDGMYYLQYSAPGTELNTYSDGYYTSTSPMGPFVYSSHSPFSSKPGGFFPGAGHGSTMQDRHGNFWHVATMRISKNYTFERRIGIFPAGFDADGVLFCNQEFADYPMTVPAAAADPWSLSASSMLLSYRTPTTASSSDPHHTPALATDEDVQTWWVAADTSPGEWVQTELAPGSVVEAVQVNLAEHAVRPPKPARSDTSVVIPFRRHIHPETPTAEVLVQVSNDGASWTTLVDTRGASDSRSHLFVELETPGEYRYVRVTGFAQPFGSRLAVSGLRVFGKGAGTAPTAVVPAAVRIGAMDARISWTVVDGAQGYNVRYGIAPDKLYSSWQVFEQNSLDLGSLNAGVPYWVAVDAFNENGVTRGTAVPVR